MIGLRSCSIVMSKQKKFEEERYYNEILQCFSSENRSENEKGIWKYSKLIELMSFLRDEDTQESVRANKLVQNTIILLLALFDDLAPDYYSKIGTDSKLISNAEKKELKEALLSELAN